MKVSLISFFNKLKGVPRTWSSFWRISFRVGRVLLRVLKESSKSVGIWILASWLAEGTVNWGGVTLGAKGIELNASANDLMAEFAFCTSEAIAELMLASVLFRKPVI